AVPPGGGRGWGAGGGGAWGDRACHTRALPFWALGLRHPETIAAEGPEVHPDGAPQWCQARYEFPARGNQPAVKLFWSDGGKHHEIVADTKDYEDKPLKEWGLGILFLGAKGLLAANY